MIMYKDSIYIFNDNLQQLRKNKKNFFIFLFDRNLNIFILVILIYKRMERIRVAHNITDFDEGEEVILTLKDQQLIKGNQLNQDIQELQNISLRQKQETQFKVYMKQNLKKMAHAQTSHLQYKLEGKGQNVLLPHYDQKIYHNQGFTIEKDQQNQFFAPKNIFQTLRQQKQSENIFFKQNKIASQYQSVEKKPVKFRKPVDKVKKTKQLMNFLEQTIEQDDQIDPKKRKAAQHIQQSLDKLKKKKNYEKALQKAMINNVNAQQKLRSIEEYQLELTLQRQKKKNFKEQQSVTKLLQQNLKNTQIPQQKNTVEIQIDPLKIGAKALESTSEIHHQQKKYKITDAKNGFTSVLNVCLPSQRLEKQKQLKQLQELPQHMEDIPQQELQRMKKQLEFMEQQDVGVGLSGVLKYLRERGISNNDEYVGRSTDQKPKLRNYDEDKIKLEYRDAKGKLMTPKEAFRYMCWIFHGEGPGKNKIQKRKKKELLNQRLKQTQVGDTSFMKVLKQHQQKNEQAHMFINKTK